MATTARDIMTRDPQVITEEQTVTEAARMMRDLDVGALPICGEGQRLTGVLTDRDIVVGCVAAGTDPATTTAGSMATGDPVTIGADDSFDEVMATMISHQVRRLPVLDGHRLVGIISEQNVADAGRDRNVGRTIQGLTEA